MCTMLGEAIAREFCHTRLRWFQATAGDLRNGPIQASSTRFRESLGEEVQFFTTAACFTEVKGTSATARDEGCSWFSKARTALWIRPAWTYIWLPQEHFKNT